MIRRLMILSKRLLVCCTVALASGKENKLLSEIHMCALRVLMHRQIEECKEDYNGQQDHFLLIWLALSGVTWPQHLRRFTTAKVASEVILGILRLSFD